MNGSVEGDKRQTRTETDGQTVDGTEGQRQRDVNALAGVLLIISDVSRA